MMVHLGAALLGLALGCFLVLVYLRVRARTRLEASRLDVDAFLDAQLQSALAAERRRAVRVQNSRRSARLAR